MTLNLPDPEIGTGLPPQAARSAHPNPAGNPVWPSQINPKPKWRGWHSFCLAAMIIAIVLLGLLTPLPQLIWAWIGILLLLAGFAIVTGHGILGLWMGLLIDERNKYSLSRLQMILWTIVVLSGFLTAALWNVRSGQVSTLLITVPPQLWLLMGISTTSLIGSPLILSTKMTEPVAEIPTQSQQIAFQNAMTRAALALQGLPDSVIATMGKVVIWKWPWDARIADLFQGEEIGNAAHLDLGKIQMFYFTLIMVVTYIVMLGAIFSSSTGTINALPSLPDGMVALLGISNGGYLVNKVIPHSVG